MATKSDIGQSDEKHVPQNEEFFDAETMAHAAGPDAFPAVPVDSMAPTARRTVDFFPATESGSPMDTKAFDPPSPLKDAVSWTENGTHQTAVTQENVAMSLAPPPQKQPRAWLLPLLVVVLFGGLGTLIYLQNQQIQSIANQQTAPSIQPKSTIDNNNKPGQSNPSPSAAPGPQAQKPEPPQKAKPQPATAKPKKTKKTKVKPKPKPAAEKATTPNKQPQTKSKTVTPQKTKEPASPFMRQYTKDKEPKKEEGNQFIRVNTN